VVGEALDRFSRVDTLINNAGICIGKPFTDYTVDDYDAIINVNLAGFFHITQRMRTSSKLRDRSVSGPP
jgi:NADP-dependent 3-hydroxy acid dehydrogenase YdfG